MAKLNNLTPEILDILGECETKEALLAKIAELNVELDEEDVEVLAAEIAGEEEEGELDDEAMDAVAGGGNRNFVFKWKNGYRKVGRRDTCPIGQWERAAVPSYKGVKNNYKCGNCAHGKIVNGQLVCLKQPKP